MCLGEGSEGDDAAVGDEDSASDVFCVEGGDEGVVGVGFGPQVADGDGGFWGGVVRVGRVFPWVADGDGVFPDDEDEWWRCLRVFVVF